jgi:hypothetical protein
VNPMVVGGVVFACVFSGAMMGMRLGAILPDHHLSGETKDVVKLGMGLVATMAALVVGLLIASAKSSLEKQDDEFKRMAADTLVLDRVLAHYGPETKEARDLIKRVVAIRLDATWPEDGSRATLHSADTMPLMESVQDKIRELAPRNDAQRWLQSRALQLSDDAVQARWTLFERKGSSIPVPFLVVLVFWVTMILGSFGLFAPRNATVVGVLLVCALSIAGALFLILEMDQPFDGLMKISSAPLRYTLAHLGQ